jgi:hypothetical protein
VIALAFYLGGLTVMVCGLGMTGRLNSIQYWWTCFSWPVQVTMALAGWAISTQRKKPPASWFD